MYWAWLEGIPYSRNRFEEYISIEREGGGGRREGREREGRKGGREGDRFYAY